MRRRKNTWRRDLTSDLKKSGETLGEAKTSQKTDGDGK